jgi:5'-3' exonuclease
MGIFKLQTFIKNNCNNAIQMKSLYSFSDKRVAIDVISLLYKFKKENDMLYKLFMFCSLFRELNIHMCMVFDGIPSVEKLETIQRRRDQKRRAKSNMKLLQAKLHSGEIQDTFGTMKELQWYHDQSTHVTKEDIKTVQELLTLYGIHWIVSNNEADYVCGYLAKTNIVDAVISDDTDMFVLGCPTVIRFVSIVQNTCVVYKLCEILDILKLSYTEFEYLCSISKSDYNTSIDTPTFEQHYKKLMNGALTIENEKNKIYTQELEKAREYINDLNIEQFENLQFNPYQLQTFLEKHNFVSY